MAKWQVKMDFFESPLIPPLWPLKWSVFHFLIDHKYKKKKKIILNSLLICIFAIILQIYK